jgi:ABC-type sugar transport system ATPase subunit
VRCEARRMVTSVRVESVVATGVEPSARGTAEVAHPVIEVTSLHKAYGATVAVEDVSFGVGEGEISGSWGLTDMERRLERRDKPAWR